MQADLYTIARDNLDVLARASFNVDLETAKSPLIKAADFFRLLRSNLDAAGLHAAMGHAGPRFRECDRPACLDAAQMIPRMEEIEPGATDAELGTMLKEVLAELESNLLKAGASSYYAAPM